MTTVQLTTLGHLFPSKVMANPWTFAEHLFLPRLFTVTAFWVPCTLRDTRKNTPCWLDMRSLLMPIHVLCVRATSHWYPDHISNMNSIRWWNRMLQSLPDPVLKNHRCPHSHLGMVPALRYKWLHMDRFKNDHAFWHIICYWCFFHSWLLTNQT